MSRLVPGLLWFAALSGVAQATPCDRGLLARQGSVTELTRYNPMHQPTGKLVSTIVSSVPNGGGVTAVQTIDNYVGANKVSSSTVDLVCDGKTVSISPRNQDAIAELEAHATSPAKAGSVTRFSEAQIYPLAFKVGDTLPPHRAYNLTVARREPDWSKLAPKGDWHAVLGWALDKKVASGTQLITINTKVAAKESCAIPGAGSVPCLRITKQVVSKPLSGAADLESKVDDTAGGASAQQVVEWFAPGIGVVKTQIGMAGQPIVSLEMTSLKK